MPHEQGPADYDTDPVASIADPANPLHGPRSRYWMFCIWNLFPEDTPDDHQRYETMPNEIRRLFLEFQGISALYFKAARWKAEIAPKTRRCHIQCFVEAKNKKLKRLEVLAFLAPLSMPWDLEGCEPINPYCPKGAWDYIGKQDTTMPGAIVYEFGIPPPPGLFPRRGGPRPNAGSKLNCSEEDFKLLSEKCGRAPVETWLPHVYKKMKVGEVAKIIENSREPQFLGFESYKYNTWIYSEEGNLGKTSAGIDWCIRNRKKFLFLPKTNGYFGQWGDGWNWPDVLMMNEFTGNWLDGFHDFLDFLDNQMERILWLKGKKTCCGCRIIFINGNVAPEHCLWLFPPSKIPRPAEAHELQLLYRRFELARLVGGGIIRWEAGIPVAEFHRQQFLWDLYMIREMEQLCNEHGRAEGIRQFDMNWAREEEDAPRQNELREAEAFIERINNPPEDAFAALARLAREEAEAEENRRIALAIQIPEAAPGTIIDLNALPEENTEEAEKAEEAYLLPFIENEAEEDEIPEPSVEGEPEPPPSPIGPPGRRTIVED